ncbi:MAG: hypothetical protein IMZ71_02725, partial [Chloroflexi bacterium]|nr:hypothetical protein [Chloroflexota bacterium]
MAVTCTHFRFGSDDGTEATHTFKANLDTNPTHDWAWATFLLRLTEQDTVAAASNEAATFRYSKNGGTWTAITTSSANVKSVTPAAWANGANCTKRLTGTGTFESSGAGCTVDGTSGGTA